MTLKTQNPVIDKGFNGREEYLAWRTAWKEAYAKLSADIKDHKKQRKDPDLAVRCTNQWNAAVKRVYAKRFLEVRKESKVEAQRQYLAAHAPVAA